VGSGDHGFALELGLYLRTATDGLKHAVSGLSVDQSIGYGSAGSADVNHRDDPFQFVVTGFMKEVTDAEDSCSSSRKVRGKRGSGAAENAHHGIQFSSAVLEVRTSHRKIRNVEGCDRCKQASILLVPEPVLARPLRRSHAHQG
jgi:hypothetical protein